MFRRSVMIPITWSAKKGLSGISLLQKRRIPCIWVMKSFLILLALTSGCPYGWKRNCLVVPSAQSTTEEEREISEVEMGVQDVVLHKEPSLSKSHTREEQLRGLVGPPPLEVPRKVMTISRCMIGGRRDGRRRT